jgi:hypothetical protein
MSAISSSTTAPSPENPIPPGDVLEWLDQPPDIPDEAAGITGELLVWEELDSFFTPAEDFFWVAHYGIPPEESLTPYRLTIDGLVDRPQSLTLDDLERRPRRDVDFTLECSGTPTPARTSSSAASARRGGRGRRSPRCCAARASRTRPPTWCSGGPTKEL